MKFIEESLNELSSFETKIKDYSTNIDSIPGEEKEEILVVLITEFNRFQRVINENLNYSLLSGEYISNKKFQESILDFKTKVSNLLDSVINIQDIQDTTYQLVEGLNITIDLYIHFYSDIVNRYSINSKDYIFTINSIVDSIYHNEKLKKETKDYINFFRINIQSSQYDLLLSQENNRLVSLFGIEKSIKRVTPIGLEAISDLIVQKCNFLKTKWFLRKREEAPDETLFMIDGKEHQMEINTNQLFADWSNYSAIHYELENNWKGLLDDASRQLHIKELKNLKFLEIHRLIKYNKDFDRDIEELEKISDFLYDKSQSSGNSEESFFDEYAFGVMSNYALNNKFSLFVEKNNNLSSLEQEYSKTKKKSNKFLNNFFLEFKFLNAALDILQNQLSNLDNNIFLESHEAFIKENLKKIYEKYEYNHNWSLKRHNYIFQLPFSECKVPIAENKRITFLFVASSFVLPPSLKKLETQFNNIKSKYSQILQHLESIKILKTDIDKIESLNKEIQSQKVTIDRNQIRFIEILGIFTALMAYIFGSTSTFQFLKTPQEYLLFNVAFALSLISFVSILIIFIRGRETLKRNWFWLLILFALFMLFWASIVYFDFIPSGKSKSGDSRNKFDSIKITNTLKEPIITHKIDSAVNIPTSRIKPTNDSTIVKPILKLMKK